MSHTSAGWGRGTLCLPTTRPDTPSRACVCVSLSLSRVSVWNRCPLMSHTSAGWGRGKLSLPTTRPDTPSRECVCVSLALSLSIYLSVVYVVCVCWSRIPLNESYQCKVRAGDVVCPLPDRTHRRVSVCVSLSLSLSRVCCVCVGVGYLLMSHTSAGWGRGTLCLPTTRPDTPSRECVCLSLSLSLSCVCVGIGCHLMSRTSAEWGRGTLCLLTTRPDTPSRECVSLSLSLVCVLCVLE